MCIAEIQVVTCGTVHRYSSEVQVEAVLVGQGMASRTEGAGTEAQEKIPVGILKGRMSHYFSNVFQPEGIASVFGQLLVVGISLFTTCHAVETELKVSSQVSLAVVDVPGCIRIACFAGQKIGKGQALASGTG